MRRRRWPWVVAAMAMATFVLAAAVDQASDLSANALFFSIAASLMLVGALLMTRAPGNLVGVLLLGSGILLTAGVSLSTYSRLGSAAEPIWPGSVAFGVVADLFYVFPVVIALIGIPLVFPDGHLPSRRFRWVAWLTLLAMAAITIASLFYPGKAGQTGPDNPLGIPALVPFLDALDDFANLTALIGFGGGAAALWVRFHRGDPILREQVKWLLATAGLATIAFPAAFVLSAFSVPALSGLGDGLFLLGFVAMLLLPISVGIAVLRYRLYDIDRIVSRTIGYGLVTGLLVIVFSGAVIAFEAVLAGVTDTGGETLAVAGSTLLAFALFQPLRRRVQRAVDRRFDRSRYDGERTSAAFSERLRDEVDLATVTADLDATVRGVMAPTVMSVWLRDGTR